MNPTDEAIFYITKWYQRIGAMDNREVIPDLPSPFHIMTKAANDMLESEPSDAFPDRHREHIAYALGMVALNPFLSPAAAVGAFYLATRFEFYFRILSGRLKADGRWKSKTDQQKMWRLLGDTRLNRDRINSVALSYKIMKTNKELPLSKVCNDLDKDLFRPRMDISDKTTISDIGDRIEYLRHRSAHGRQGDISSDAHFYGLMTAIVFYNQL